jgi:hypothetical protein
LLSRLSFSTECVNNCRSIGEFQFDVVPGSAQHQLCLKYGRFPCLFKKFELQNPAFFSVCVRLLLENRTVPAPKNSPVRYRTHSLASRFFKLLTYRYFLLKAVFWNRNICVFDFLHLNFFLFTFYNKFDETYQFFPCKKA